MVDCVDKFETNIRIAFKFWIAFWFSKRHLFSDRHEKQAIVTNNPTKGKSTQRDGGVLTFCLFERFGKV